MKPLCITQTEEAIENFSRARRADVIAMWQNRHLWHSWISVRKEIDAEHPTKDALWRSRRASTVFQNRFGAYADNILQRYRNGGLKRDIKLYTDILGFLNDCLVADPKIIYEFLTAEESVAIELSRKHRWMMVMSPKQVTEILAFRMAFDF